MKTYVIIGGGVAAVGCVEGIRSVDKGARIVLIAGEGRLPYCRPLISYYLEGKTDFEKMKYRPEDFYTENSVEVVYDTAVSVDPASRTVALGGGGTVKYDAVCLATGSRPFVPPIPGLENVTRKFGFMTEEDAIALDGAIYPGCRVLIVGAGLIGLKCAEGLCGRAGSITVCDLAPRVLSSILDGTASSLMQACLEEHGVRFMLGDTAESFLPGVARMKSGVDVAFDVLVLAVGVRANVSLAKDAGCEVGRGIAVDTHMRTTVAGIYAAGDCVEAEDASGGGRRVMAIMPNAVIGGRCAGVNMAGGDGTFDSAVPMNAIGFFGLHALTAGTYEGELYEEKGERTLRRFYVKDGYLSGFMLIGAVDRAGIYTSLIRNRIPLDTVDFEALRKAPSMRGFSSEYRREHMEGWK